MPRVLILSGTGWAGHQVARMLAESKHDVIVTSRGMCKRYPVAPSVNTVKADRRDIEALDQIMKERSPQLLSGWLLQPFRFWPA